MKAVVGSFIASALALGGVACGGATQSKQLADARITYQRADEGYARQYSPADLVEAKKLLKKAEEADDGSVDEVHYAYLADRAARLAESRGAQAYNREVETKAEQSYVKSQEQARLRAEQELARTQGALKDLNAAMEQQDADLVTLQNRKKELEGEQSRLETQLGHERTARAEAEAEAASALESLRAIASVQEKESETVITLAGSVLFKTGESTLLPNAEKNLLRVTEALKSFALERKVVVEGHTDSVGTDQANLELSRARAESVRTFLVTHGLAPDRVEARGLGEAQPVASNDTPEGRANNRRVELVIERKDQATEKQASR